MRATRVFVVAFARYQIPMSRCMPSASSAARVQGRRVRIQTPVLPVRRALAAAGRCPGGGYCGGGVQKGCRKGGGGGGKGKGSSGGGKGKGGGGSARK